jgi:magnesium-transporting ATPase (P-type)
VLKNCTDFWNGENVEPLTEQKRKDVRDVVTQWESTDFDSIGFSYKPVTEDFEAEIKECVKEGRSYRKPEAKSFVTNQIFLGLIAIKHHKRRDAKEQIRDMDRAGIRPVLFSSEGVFETKQLAQELGLNSEWNSWISLSESPSEFTQRVNRNGFKILPSGIKEIKEHLVKTDLIPLQVSSFCDKSWETTKQMF